MGFIKIYILYHANKEPIYGAGLMEEVGRHGYNVSPGLIYPKLKSLESKGLLTRSKYVVEGKVRKFYETTESGLEVLDEYRKRITGLVN